MKALWAGLDFTAFKNLLVGYLPNDRLVDSRARLCGRPIADW